MNEVKSDLLGYQTGRPWHDRSTEAVAMVAHRMKMVTRIRATVHLLYILRARRHLQDEKATTGPGVETAVAQAKETHRLQWVSLPRPTVVAGEANDRRTGTQWFI